VDNEPFGWSLALDLYGCAEDRLVNSSQLAAYVTQLCSDVLHMRRYGDPIIEWFGEANVKTAGYSLVQLIETSSVVGHFSPSRRSAHLDVFSCSEFSVGNVTDFSREWFRATSNASSYVVRR